jgi:hypothetical protein
MPCGTCDEVQGEVCECAICVCELQKKSADFIEHSRATGQHDLTVLRRLLISQLHDILFRQFDDFDQASGHPTSPENRRLALREYVKARTSHFARSDGWEDIAILHKRKSEGLNVAEQQKYHQVAELCYAEWNLGSATDMEESGQIYGPAIPGFSFAGGLGGLPINGDGPAAPGGHTWAVNAAWLLGHMHARHRLIQVVPNTRDNLMRGSVPAEIGALYYESMLVRFVGGMVLGRTDGPWAEYLPTRCTHHTRLASLTQATVDALAGYAVGPDIPMADVVGAVHAAEGGPNVYESFQSWVDGQRVLRWRYKRNL